MVKVLYTGARLRNKRDKQRRKKRVESAKDTTRNALGAGKRGPRGTKTTKEGRKLAREEKEAAAREAAFEEFKARSKRTTKLLNDKKFKAKGSKKNTSSLYADLDIKGLYGGLRMNGGSGSFQDRSARSKSISIDDVELMANVEPCGPGEDEHDRAMMLDD